MVEAGKPATKKSALIQAETDKGAEVPARSMLKCWQEGRLIYETSGISVAGSDAVATGVKGANGRSLQLLDLRQALCILERNNG
jgi:hypothetical protein